MEGETAKAMAEQRLEVVLKDVAITLKEAEVAALLQEQGINVLGVTRFHRTARGKPPKLLPLCRVVCAAAADMQRLLSGGAVLGGINCPGGLPACAADSASAMGWQASKAGPAAQQRTRTAIDAVAPWQDVPYEEQLARKQAAVRETLCTLPGTMLKLAAKLDDAQRQALNSLPWLQEPVLERHSGLPCELQEIVPSPITQGYRNKCEFSIGRDANGSPCVGFVLGQVDRRTRAITIGTPTGCRLLSAQMMATVARVEGVVRASPLPPYDRIQNSGFWLQLAVRQSFNAGAPPALLVCLAVKVGGFSDEAVESQVAAVIAAFDAPLEPAATVSITVQRESARQGSVPTARAEAVLGKPWIDEVLCGRSFRVSPSAFFQVNSRGAEQLCHLLRGVAGLSATTTLLDVCCGTGTIGIALADGVRQVIGIEVNAEAVRDAERNAERNQVREPPRQRQPCEGPTSSDRSPGCNEIVVRWRCRWQCIGRRL